MVNSMGKCGGQWCRRWQQWWHNAPLLRLIYHFDKKETQCGKTVNKIYAFERRFGQHFCEITIFTLDVLYASRPTPKKWILFFSCILLLLLLTHELSHPARTHTSNAQKLPTEKCLQPHSSECGKSTRFGLVRFTMSLRQECRPPSSAHLLVITKYIIEKAKKHTLPSGFKFMNIVKEQIYSKCWRTVRCHRRPFRKSRILNPSDMSICWRHEICMPTQNHHHHHHHHQGWEEKKKAKPIDNNNRPSGVCWAKDEANDEHANLPLRFIVTSFLPQFFMLSSTRADTQTHICK